MRVTRLTEGLRVESSSEADTGRLGAALAGIVGPSAVIGLVGPLGAGKTRLSRAIAEGLGVDPGAISSPTFVLIHEYEGRLPVFHFDAYRLESLRAFEELGVSDYWRAGGVCLVEWADRVRELLPADAWWITIEPMGETDRSVVIAFPPEYRLIADELERSLGLDKPSHAQGRPAE
jgi:tRNA threonylcarbamoyladenosine biosynthesis protein TsaE